MFYHRTYNTKLKKIQSFFTWVLVLTAPYMIWNLYQTGKKLNYIEFYSKNKKN